MRASRLLSLLLLLQTRGRMTAQQLATELEVTPRTVYRDIESLSSAGIPVYADRGPAGGYQLVAGYRAGLTGLTSVEADALALAGMPSAATELGLGTVLAGAQLKVLAALPPDLRERAGRIRERFHLDMPGWFRDAETPPHLATIADAVWNTHCVQVRYRRWDRSEVTRRIEPLGVVLKAGVWYAVVRSSNQVRTYRVGRVLAATTLPDRFSRPADFDLAAYWEEWSKRLTDTLYREEAVIRVSPAGWQLLFLLGPVVRRAAESTAEPADAGGWRRAVVPIESHRHAVHSFGQLGAELEVVEPTALRDRVAAAARATVVLYSAQGS